MSQTSVEIEAMTAGAVLPAAKAVSAAPVPEAAPAVFIDGVLRNDWAVRSVTVEGPTDQRTAHVRSMNVADSAAGGVAVNCDSPDGVVVIAQPVALIGGVTRWLPLLIGRFAHHQQRIGGRGLERGFEVIDDWAALLNQSLDEPIVAPDVEAALLAWRRRAGLSVAEMNFERLSAALRGRALPGGQLAGRTVGDALRTLLADHGLRVAQHLTWRGGATRRVVMIEPAERGQPIRLAADQVGQPAANLAAIERRHQAARPMRWMAEATPRAVESTFELQPAWSAEAMELPDDQYARSTSDDYEAVAHVFRLWVLNEDGAFTGGAIDLGEPFDLTALFDDGRPIPPQALRFGPALTLDPAGRSVGVVIDRSIDSGATWQRITSAVRVLTDRAGVLLDDDALPTDWLTANRDGTARLRVTATLRHPEPMRVIRWAGNPFLGPFDTRRVSVGATFGWRAVLPGSRFHEAVRSGGLAADETDDRATLDRWLAERVALSRTEPHGDAHGDARLRLTHSGLQIGLRIGDRLTHLAGRYLRPAEQPRLVRIGHEFTRRRTVTEWRSP